jgi:hypothetical protein
MHKINEDNMFAQYSYLFPKTLHPSDDQTHLYHVIIDEWESGEKMGITTTIYNQDKVQWESKTKDPNANVAEWKKMVDMVKTLKLNLNSLSIVKKINGRTVDELGEGRNDFAKFKYGIKVGQVIDHGPTVEVAVPRSIDGSTEAMRDYISKGYKYLAASKHTNKITLMSFKKPQAVAESNGESVEPVNEYVLNFQQRRKRAMNIKRIKNKLKVGRERHAKRLATQDELMVRARRMAIQIVRRRFAGKMGQQYRNLTAGEKIQVDKKIQGKAGLVKKIAARILPKVRAAELQRYRDRQAHKQAEAEHATKKDSGK